MINNTNKMVDNSDIILSKIICNIINALQKDLDFEQLSKIKDLLYINFKDIGMYETFELATNDLADVELMKYFAANKKMPGKSDKTIKQYLRAIKNLREELQKNFKDITTGDIKYYLAMRKMQRNWSNVTTNNEIMYLNSFFEFLTVEEYITSNPLNKIEKIKIEYVIPDPFTVDEVEKLKNIAMENNRDIAMIEFLLATGVRVSELCSIKWSDFNTNDNKIKVIGKGNKQRKVRFSETAKFYLNKYFESRCRKEHRTSDEMYMRPLFVKMRRDPKTHDWEALTTDGIRSILNRIAEEAHVENVHPHKFRRTFATNMINRGMPIEDIKDLLGHNSCDTTLKYAILSDNKTEASYKSCNY